MDIAAQQKKYGKTFCICFAGFLFLLISAKIVYEGWITEDAYIFFRVVDNFINGFGLRWNTDERVQVFTNPLWTLIHIIFMSITREEYLTSLFLCYFFSLSAVGILIYRFHRQPWLLLLFFFIPATLSKPFLEFSSSGLETPLIYFLLSVYSYLSYRDAEKNWQGMALCAGLSAFTRLDTIILYIPSLIFFSLRYYSPLNMKRLFSGFIPLIAWLAFSLFYYGFIFPNTKYAKINTGIFIDDYIAQGIRYFFDIFKNHLPTAITIVLNYFVCISCIVKVVNDERDFRILNSLFLSVGVVSYSIYVLLVGGDFMSGRFWSPVFVLSVIVNLYFFDYIFSRSGNKYSLYYAIIYLLLFTLSYQINYYIEDTHTTIRSDGIANEKLFYSEHTPLPRYIEHGYKNSFYWLDWGRSERANSIKKTSKSIGRRYTIVFSAVGMLGYKAGPYVTIIDVFGLGDALLARLPVDDPQHWRIGHFGRAIPDGYKEARISSDYDKMDKDLAIYYRALRNITSGPLFDFGRLEDIIRFNFGEYNIYLDKYLRKKGRT